MVELEECELVEMEQFREAIEAKKVSKMRK
jgi:hypothetical protein